MHDVCQRMKHSEQQSYPQNRSITITLSYLQVENNIFVATCSLLALKFRSISRAKGESAIAAYISAVQPLPSNSSRGALGPFCY